LHSNIIIDNLLFSDNSIEKISVFNEAGLEVMNIDNPKNPVNVKHLPAAIYFLQAKGF